MKKLKQVTVEEFNEFLKNYKGEIVRHRWNEIVVYNDFNMQSEHAPGTDEWAIDCIIARSYEPYTNTPSEYFILK